MIFVLATIEVAPGRRNDFLAEFHRLMPLVHAEEGCLEYGPAVDVKTQIAAQGSVRENTVVIVEKWQNLPALETHLNASHMQEYRVRVKELVRSVSLQILEPA